MAEDRQALVTVGAWFPSLFSVHQKMNWKKGHQPKPENQRGHTKIERTKGYNTRELVYRVFRLKGGGTRVLLSKRRAAICSLTLYYAKIFFIKL